jgi:protein-S-isoprenylcysteine O-methyltransferase Ste14
MDRMDMTDAGQVDAVPLRDRRIWRKGPRRFYRWRVPAAFLVGALTLVLAKPTAMSLLVALTLIAPGLGLRLWASGHIEKTRQLATGGPYRHTQHPLYLGSFLIALGVAVAAAHVWVLLAVGAYLLAFFPYVMRNEQEFLHKRFGAEYELWAAEVPAFFPRLLPAGPRSTRFEWRRVLSNHEWQVCLAPPAVLALLYLKDFLVP